MAPASTPPRRLLLAALLVQLAAGATAVWIFAGEGYREADARRRCANLSAAAELQSALTDADRTMLFAVIQSERLHPDVAVTFRMCLERARRGCREARARAAVPGEGEELERLAMRLEEMSQRGARLLAAPADERMNHYHAPGRGFQAATTAARFHADAVRVLNEVALEDYHQAAWWAAPRAMNAVAAFGALSLLLTATAVWRQFRHTQRAAAGAAPVSVG